MAGALFAISKLCLAKYSAAFTFPAGSPWYSNLTSPQAQLPLAIAIDSEENFRILRRIEVEQSLFQTA